MSNEQREQALYHAIYIERLPNLEVEPFAKGWQAALTHQGTTLTKEATIKRLQDPETMRLHMGELTPSEVLVAQAAVRYALAHQGRVVPVSVLEGFIDAMEVSTRVPTANSTPEWEEGYSNGVNIALDELRAIIEKGEV